MTVGTTGGSAAADSGDGPPSARRFAIRATSESAKNLASQLPNSAVELGMIAGNADHPGQLCCVLLDAPIKYHFDVTQAARYEPDYCHQDRDGQFFQVHIALLSESDAGSLAPGGRNVRVQVAYVIDLSLEQDNVLNADKVDWVGPAVVDISIDEVADAQSPSHPAAAAAPPAPAAPTPRYARHASEQSSSAAPLPTQRPPLPAQTAAESQASEWLRHQIGVHIAALKRLAGQTSGSDVPVPTEMKKSDAPSNAAPQYVLDGAQLWYHSRHPQKGFFWRSTTDHQELIYWCVDDVARGLAWRWTQQAPGYKKMTAAAAQRTLWAPYWQLLMNALDPKWGALTGRNLRDLL